MNNNYLFGWLWISILNVALLVMLSGLIKDVIEYGYSWNWLIATGIIILIFNIYMISEIKGMKEQ